MTLLLSEHDVQLAFRMDRAIAALSDSFAALASGAAVNRPRSHTYTDLGDGRHHLLKTMDGAVATLGVHALRVTSDHVAEEMTGGRRRRVKLPSAPGAHYVGLVILFDQATLVPRAIMPDGYLQRMRVGATSALAARHLARVDSRVAGLIGTGWQAGAQLLALAADRPLEEVRVHSPTTDRMQAFVREHESLVDVPLTMVASVREAVAGADIVALATNSLDPVLAGHWLEPGQHVSSVQGHELDHETYRRAAVIGVRSLEPSTYHHAPGHAPTEADAEPEMDDELRAKMVELGAIVGGARGRTGDREITLFTGSHSGAGSGLGTQFAAVAHAIAGEAAEMGLGRELPTAWFTQAGRP